MGSSITIPPLPPAPKASASPIDEWAAAARRRALLGGQSLGRGRAASFLTGPQGDTSPTNLAKPGRTTIGA